MNVITLTHRYANCFLIPSSKGWVMIDAGWPDTLPQMLQLLRQNDIFINDIDYLIITHFHPDHSGLTQNLKDYGTKLILHECQVSYVNKINSFFKKNPKEHFKDIVTGDNIVVSSSESRSFLKEIGIDGEIIQTPGHSDDSISLVVDDCCAFTGDLADLSLLEEFHDPVMNESWERIKKYNVKMIYPGHRNPYPVE